VAVRSVVFDVGETLVSDRRFWADWAEWIGVPAETFLVVLGAVVGAGRDNAETFGYFRPGVDLAAEYELRERAGRGERIEEADLYPDVRPALTALREAGIWVGVVGNQTRHAAGLLRALELPADLVATSGEWGVAKPSPEFFARIVQEAPGGPHEIVYVGDHPANDITPARGAGLRAAHVRRGPWGHLWAAEGASAADWQVDSLTELVAIAHAQ
jgi:HAD superfamily hydrolase (TIGR01549 family)